MLQFSPDGPQATATSNNSQVGAVSDEADFSTPVKTARAKRGTAGTFQGRRPPKNHVKLELCLMKKQQHDEAVAKRAAERKGRKQLEVAQPKADSEPLRPVQYKPKGKAKARRQISAWQSFVKANYANVPAHCDSFGSKIKHLQSIWADLRKIPVDNSDGEGKETDGNDDTDPGAQGCHLVDMDVDANNSESAENSSDSGVAIS